jgi:hypothetical protein
LNSDESSDNEGIPEEEKSSRTEERKPSKPEAESEGEKNQQSLNSEKRYSGVGKAKEENYLITKVHKK